MLGPAILRPSARITHSCVKHKTRRYRGLSTPASSSSRSTLKGRHWKSSESRHERPTILAENKCANVRSWDLLSGPAEALTLISAVEQKYGPVESIIFQKDFDRPNLYQTHVRVTFRDIESLLRVPEGTETIHIRAPRLQAKRPGGIGLDEILPLMSEGPEFLTADQVSEMSPEDQSIDFRIKRSASFSLTMSPFPRVYLSKPSQMGYEMLNWGGFYDMKPIDSALPITNQDLTEETLDHIHMRMALRDWARYLGVRNPYEVYRDETMEGEGQELDPPSSLAETDEKMVESLSVSEQDWVSDALKSGSVRDPFEEILDMKDNNLTGPKMEPVGATNDATEVPQSDSTPSTTTDLTSSSNELEHKQEPSSTTPSLAQSSSQFDSPTSTAEGEAQGQEPKEANRKVDESLKAQLVEAKRLRELAQSTRSPKEKQNAPTKSKNRGKKQKVAPKPVTRKGANKQDAKPLSGLGGLFNRIQNLFRRS